jgi:formamidopyrimidine-DNA glycosylase
LPELPEVETIRRGLEPKVKDRTILRAEVRLAKQVEGLPVADFCRKMAGQKIVSVDRRGKFLLFGLGRGTLAIHLGMSGQVTYWDHARQDSPGFLVHRHTGLQKTPGQHAPDKHTHALFHLDQGDRIQYRDIRQFGLLRFLAPGELERWPSISRLGLEPLAKDYTFERFEALLERHKGGLKARLLAQHPVAGLGNIYADEALYLASLHPLKKIQALKEAERRALFEAIPLVLRKGIRNGGTTLMDFRGAEGEHGSNQNSLQVYGRAGENCYRCGAVLSKILVAQRTTVYCPRCQKKR